MPRGPPRRRTLASAGDARSDPTELGARLRDRDLSVAPAVLNLVENRTPAGRGAVAELLRAVSPAALGAEAPAHLVGVTGPPGAGKSSLLSELVRAWRARDRTVAVLAVDPSSRRSGGALLGDRARIASDPGDRGVFVRSTAAGERLEGLGPRDAVGGAGPRGGVRRRRHRDRRRRAVRDRGGRRGRHGRSRRPAGVRRVLQFLKAGIMEIPDLLVVTKADMGTVADRARRDLHAALRALGSDAGVLAVSSVPRRPGPTSWSRRSTPTGPAPTSPAAACGPAAAARSPTSSPSTATAAYGALGGRRAAELFLADADLDLDVPALTRALEARALEAS